VRVLDEHGRDQPVGVPGEIYSRIAYFPDFTYRGQDDKRREIERHGLLTVGDIGYFDADGYLYLCDRKRDMVIIGGTNIYPAEIEAVLIALPGVKDCAVIGIPDAEYGEALLALVEPQEGASPDPETLHRRLAEHFSGFKLPRRIELRPSLTREDSGKIFKRRLREPYWRGSRRSI
jgi:long-chain acyl-CoA synthetase